MGLRLGDVVEAGALKESRVDATGAGAVTAANIYSVSFDAAGSPLLTNAAAPSISTAPPSRRTKITLDFSIGPNLDGSTGGQRADPAPLAPPGFRSLRGRILRHEDRMPASSRPPTAASASTSTPWPPCPPLPPSAPPSPATCSPAWWPPRPHPGERQ
jgi:hypothetical protein